MRTTLGARQDRIIIMASAVQRPSKTPKQTVNHNKVLVRTAEIAEIVALTGAVGGYARTVLISERREEMDNPKKQTIVNQTARELNAAPLGFVVPSILVAVLARGIASRLERGGSQTQKPGSSMMHQTGDLSVTLQAAVSSQSAALETISRQVDKLQIRTRLVSRDVRGQLKGVEEVTTGHSVALAALDERMERAEGDIKDLETLIAALQELSLKQFLLVKDIVSSSKRGVVASSVAKPLVPNLRVEENVRNIEEHPRPVQIDEQNEQNDEWGRPIANTVDLNQIPRSTVVH